MTEPTPHGAHAATEKQGGGLPWLWILAAIVLLGLVVWVIAAALDDDEDELEVGAPAVTEEVVEPEAVDPEPDAEAVDPEPDVEAVDPEPDVEVPPPAEAVVGTILVGEVDVLADEVPLTELIGEPVDADTVQVQELVADEAFFVGPDAGRTVMVRLPAFAGEDDPESPFEVEEGDQVSFTGTIQEIDEELLSELQLYNPAEQLETGEVYVQVEEISNVG